MEQGYPEVQIRFDQERAAALGLTSRQIADQVVRQVRGEVATRYSFRDRKIDVLVRAQRGRPRLGRRHPQASSSIPQSERPVTLDAVADVVETVGPSEIHRADQTRVAIVSANLRDVDLGPPSSEVQRCWPRTRWAPTCACASAARARNSTARCSSLMFAFGLAMFLVYLVMASQFESLLHPFVIMFTVPLAMVGAVLALWLVGSPISVVVFIGLILLVGIVVKNAIVLIDKVNQLREEGVAKREAICRGGRVAPATDHHDHPDHAVRLRPLAFFGGDGAEVRAPMAITSWSAMLDPTLPRIVIVDDNLIDLDRTHGAAALRRPRSRPGSRPGDLVAESAWPLRVSKDRNREGAAAPPIAPAACGPPGRHGGIHGIRPRSRSGYGNRLRAFNCGSPAPMPDGRVAYLTGSGIAVGRPGCAQRDLVNLPLAAGDVAALPDGRLLCTAGGSAPSSSARNRRSEQRSGRL